MRVPVDCSEHCGGESRCGTHETFLQKRACSVRHVGDYPVHLADRVGISDFVEFVFRCCVEKRSHTIVCLEADIERE
jgi:hypothetical protein